MYVSPEVERIERFRQTKGEPQERGRLQRANVLQASPPETLQNEDGAVVHDDALHWFEGSATL